MRYYFSLVDGKHSAADKYGKELGSLYEAHLHALHMFEKLIQYIPDSLSPTCIALGGNAGQPALFRPSGERTRAHSPGLIIRIQEDSYGQPYQPVDEVVAPRSPHCIMWAFAVLAATCCG